MARGIIGIFWNNILDGSITGNMKANGLIIRCMGREFLFGRMEEGMKVNMKKIS